MEPYDPRSVANAIIRFASDYNMPLSHLSLQKIVYFAHARFLIEADSPLVSGFFEAWQYGPVHPVLYTSFKQFGASNITQPATIRNLISGETMTVPEPSDRELVLFVRETAAKYLRLTPGRLVDLAHARGSPWDVVTRLPSGGRAFGIRIQDHHIRAMFRHHKISVSDIPRAGEPDEESPPS